MQLAFCGLPVVYRIPVCSSDGEGEEAAAQLNSPVVTQTVSAMCSVIVHSDVCQLDRWHTRMAFVIRFACKMRFLSVFVLAGTNFQRLGIELVAVGSVLGTITPVQKSRE